MSTINVDATKKLNRLQLLGYQSTNSSTSLSSKAILNRGTDCHWDFVLKEAIWLSTDFQNERIRLKKKARDASKAAETFYRTKDSRKSKKEKEDFIALRKVSSKISTEVRKFWLKINKLITFKQKGEYDEVRQKAMDKHLVYLVKQTERYTNLLAQNMKTGGEIGGQYISDEESLTYSRKKSTPKLIRSSTDNSITSTSMDDISVTSSNYSSVNRFRKGQSHRIENLDKSIDDDELTLDNEFDDNDEEFEADEEEPDDETTIMEAEAMEEGLNREEEISLLKRDCEIPIEKLRSMYAKYSDSDDDNDEEDNNNTIQSNNNQEEGDDDDDDDDADAEFLAIEEEPDDETTMIEEEALGNGISRDEELSLLQRESEIPIEQLRAMYANAKYSDEEEDGDDDEEENGVGEDDENMDYDENNDNNDNNVEPTTDFNTRSNSNQHNYIHDNSLETNRIQKKNNVGTVTFSEEVQMKVINNENFEVDNHEHKVEQNIGGGGGYDDDDADAEFLAIEEEPDDETTMIEEEALGNGMSRDEELSLLQRESEIPIEQLRAMYANAKYSDEEEDGDDDEEEGDDDEDMDNSENDENNDYEHEGQISKNNKTDDQKGNMIIDGDDDDDADAEFLAIEEEPDDETTMIEEEALGNGMSRDEELSLLQRESEIPIEQLRAMYANAKYSDEEEDGDDDEEEEDEEEEEENGEGEDDEDMDIENASESDKDGYSLLEGRTTSDNSVGSDSMQDALKRLEAADLAARSVHVELPFLLSKKLVLREYQHVGLNWLVSLHERRLNGILADEMGLGKTIQTIAVLAYLAAYRGLWGPHLIVVPTSCIVNWETEFKRWCPNFKVITYYGSTKARKLLRTGWSKLNAFHVCITSYQLVVQDSKVFRRKRWYYMILDEAHNIKNFKSQRWQTLLNFNTQRRLLLTGTPLQNNLMELWSLMHFLMPHIFRSRKEFSYWFNNPLSSMVEGNRNVNNDLISRLHSIMRPFLLRRLKKDVAKQLPAKYEHTVMCKLSKRQQYLYEEFMSRSSTRSLMSGENYMGMMNILMQLRKCCNHPDLFEVRSIISPFVLPGLYYNPGTLVTRAMEKNPLESIDMFWLNCLSIDEDAIVHSEAARLQVNQKAFLVVNDLNLDTPRNLQASQFKKYNDDLKALLRKQVTDRLIFNYKISSQRCNKAIIPTNWRTFKAFSIGPLPISTELLEDKEKSKWAPMCLKGLIKSINDRANEMQDINERFVFVLPKAITNKIEIVSSNPNKSEAIMRERTALMIKEPFEKALLPFYCAAIRQRIFFPDRKMVQFDSGKLQALSVLLQKLKKGGHKCLVFTQMSKMLDILEVFLNLNAHTYVRLDGSTGIGKRQKLMDRFNSDPKLFCFILSTRSGGLGINLTGADTVIFYDSDWNPAMDAQAQDRAHRIGQTREVHIYRLVCASTVEENILVKARQKKHLDFLVMTEGNFSETSIFSSHGLKDLLGAQSLPTEDIITDISGIDNTLPKIDVEAAMAAAEDEEDVKAMRGAALEVAQEAAEFDENAPIPQEDPDDENADSSSKALTIQVNNEPSVNEEIDMEKEFASWQAKLGPDFKSLENALKPVERFAIRVRTDVDPFYSIYIITDQLRLEALQAEVTGEVWNVEEIEREKEEEEYRALAEGELLAANVTRRDVSRLKEWYVAERSKRNQERRRRKLTGEGWVLKIDPVTYSPFWYNNDTGEASYKKPSIIEERDNMNLALEKRFKAMPINILVKIFQFLFASPERVNASKVCIRWSLAAKDKSFYKKVLPVESGARDTGKGPLAAGTYASIEEAIKNSLSGDTIILGAGHHWESTLIVSKPLRFVAETDDASRCVLELAGKITILKEGSGTIFAGTTIRRPRRITESIPCILAAGSTISLFNCTCNNDGSDNSSTILAVENAKVKLYGCTITGGSIAGLTLKGSHLIATNNSIKNNGTGIVALQSSINLQDTYISKNKDYAFTLFGKCLVSLLHCELKENNEGVVKFLPYDQSQSIIKASKTICDDKNVPWKRNKEQDDNKNKSLSPQEFRDAMNG